MVKKDRSIIINKTYLLKILFIARNYTHDLRNHYAVTSLRRKVDERSEASRRVA
jgi:hypothetical protein